MDDLTSKKAVFDGLMKYGFLAPDMTVHEFVEDELPSVPAVPLDKLCEWLEDNASLRHGTSVSRHSWKQMITSDLIGEKNEE